MHETITEKIKIPDGVDVSIDSALGINGPKGELKREFPVEIKKEEGYIVIEAKNATKNTKRIIKTSAAHIKNMLRGVIEGYEYLLQICSVHFPITVSADKENLHIKNFLGETRERTAKILPGVIVKINGDIITITSADIEAAGQTSANIETATKIRNRDRTRFQDGIWIIKKANEDI